MNSLHWPVVSLENECDRVQPLIWNEPKRDGQSTKMWKVKKDLFSFKKWKTGG